MARPTKWQSMVAAARHEAVLGVRLYNDAVEPRAFEAFTIHLHIAWLYLLHARFIRDKVDIRYPDRNRPRQFVRVDGEYKLWELARCAEERWSSPDDPVRKNLEFFIALRNKIEHRHDPDDRHLALAVAGHAQAFLLNFERELTNTFGGDHSLATVLRFPIFVGTFTTEGTDALKALRARLPADLRRFIAQFHDGMTEKSRGDERFELGLNVVLQQVQRGADSLSIQFSRWDDMTDAEKAAAELLGKRGQAIVREQTRLVVGHGLLKPREAEQRVAAAIPFEFNSHHFLRAWQVKRIRPPNNDPNPERTDQKYCVYDALSRSYGYTDAWVKYLIRACSTETGFENATSRSAWRKMAQS